MLNYEAPAGNTAQPDAHDAEHAADAKAFYPLTLPVSIDAGVIAVAITVGANHAQTLKSDLIQFAAAVIGSAVVATALLLIYRYAGRVSRWLGNMGMEVMLRLSALLVAQHRRADRLERLEVALGRASRRVKLGGGQDFQGSVRVS